MRLRLLVFSPAPALDAAEREGFFAREGIELDVERTTSSVEQHADLQAGRCDLVHTAADNVLSRVDAGERDVRAYVVADLGLDLRLVACGVRTARELSGRRLAVDAPWSGHALLMYTLLVRAGVRRGDWQAVPVGGSGPRSAALRDGRADAAVLSPPHDEEAVARGCVVLADCAREFPLHPGLTVAARPSWAARNEGALVGYLRALVAGQRASGAAVPSVDRQRESLLGALRLRRSLTDGAVPGAADIDAVFDPAFALRADPTLG